MQIAFLYTFLPFRFIKVS